MFRIQKGQLRESNPRPLAPKARIIPLDQAANNQTRIIFILLAVIIKQNRIAMKV